jgi:hypothetical protein
MFVQESALIIRSLTTMLHVHDFKQYARFWKYKALQFFIHSFII